MSKLSQTEIDLISEIVLKCVRLGVETNMIPSRMRLRLEEMHAREPINLAGVLKLNNEKFVRRIRKLGF